MFEKIKYKSLNSRQKENFNFHKIAGELADYGYNSLRLNDDWQGADFLAVHINGSDVLRVQLKGRLSLDKKYVGKQIYIAFIDGEDSYMYPHDEFLKTTLQMGKIIKSKGWDEKGKRSWPKPPKWAKKALIPYKI